MHQPEVSIIILEYFSHEEVGRCISSLHKNLETIKHEIIVSSNSCYDQNRQKLIIEEYSDAIWIFNTKNGGFAFGMNRGLEKASGRYLLIINSDITFLEGFSKMLSFMDSHPEAGAIGPQMIDADGIIQDNCRPYVSLSRFIKRQIRRIISHEIAIRDKKFDYSKIQTVDWLAGAFIMVPRTVYELTGGLNDNYFMYAEDMDWCTRIRKSGYEIIYYPKMRIIYKGSRYARKLNKYTLIFINSHLKYWLRFGFFFGYPQRKEYKYE